MRIDIFYFDGCPNHRATVDLIEDVVRSLGLIAAIREVRVHDAEEAARLRFLGSPTVHVNGEDIDPGARGRIDYSFSCRLYDRAGAPSRNLIERALRCGKTDSP